ncbi:MAG: hypothetical protein K0Q69_1175 [Devosia sp.]|jgi:hypothetical protein|nr:hypothetical protein [Devosia sp.]
MIDASTVPRWRFRDALRAAGISHHRLARWLDRGIVRLRPYDTETAGTGSPRLFSRRRLYQFAIIAELARLGISADRAARAALAFTDHDQPGRAAGHLFPDGPTWLAVTPDADLVVRPPEAEGAAQLFTAGLAPGLPTSIVLLDLGALVLRVDEALSQETQ